MTLKQANLSKIRYKSALCAHKFSLKILLQVNLRLRACLKYGRFKPKRAYKARAYKKGVMENALEMVGKHLVNYLGNTLEILGK